MVPMHIVPNQQSNIHPLPHHCMASILWNPELTSCFAMLNNHYSWPTMVVKILMRQMKERWQYLLKLSHGEKEHEILTMQHDSKKNKKCLKSPSRACIKLRVTPWRGQIGSSWIPATSSDTFFQSVWFTIVLAALCRKANADTTVSKEMDCLTHPISCTPHLLTHSGKNRHRSMNRSASWRSWTEFLRLLNDFSDYLFIPSVISTQPEDIAPQKSQAWTTPASTRTILRKKRLAQITPSKICQSDLKFWTKRIALYTLFFFIYVCLLGNCCQASEQLPLPAWERRPFNIEKNKAHHITWCSFHWICTWHLGSYSS